MILIQTRVFAAESDDPHVPPLPDILRQCLLTLLHWCVCRERPKLVRKTEVATVHKSLIRNLHYEHVSGDKFSDSVILLTRVCTPVTKSDRLYSSTTL